MLLTKNVHVILCKIGHFRVQLTLNFKARLSAKPLLWKAVFIHIEIGLIIITKISLLDSLWKRDWVELGNGLFYDDVILTCMAFNPGFSLTARGWLKNRLLGVLGCLLFKEIEESEKGTRLPSHLLLHPGSLLQNLMRTLQPTSFSKNE